MRYDFACPECGIIEIEHPMKDDHPKECPECGSEIKRHFGEAPPVHFISSRGGGVDDWASKQAPAPQHPTHPESDVPYRDNPTKQHELDITVGDPPMRRKTVFPVN